MVCYNPERAKLDQQKREEVIERLTVKLKDATIKSLVTNPEYKRFLKIVTRVNHFLHSELDAGERRDTGALERSTDHGWGGKDQHDRDDDHRFPRGGEQMRSSLHRVFGWF